MVELDSEKRKLVDIVGFSEAPAHIQQIAAYACMQIIASARATDLMPADVSARRISIATALLTMHTMNPLRNLSGLRSDQITF